MVLAISPPFFRPVNHIRYIFFNITNTTRFLIATLNLDQNQERRTRPQILQPMLVQFDEEDGNLQITIFFTYSLSLDPCRPLSPNGLHSPSWIIFLHVILTLNPQSSHAVHRPQTSGVRWWRRRRWRQGRRQLGKERLQAAHWWSYAQWHKIALLHFRGSNISHGAASYNNIGPAAARHVVVIVVMVVVFLNLDWDQWQRWRVGKEETRDAL